MSSTSSATASESWPVPQRVDAERRDVVVRVELSYPPLELMAKSKVLAEVPAYLAKIGAKGGKHSSGAGDRIVWKDVPAAERTRRMRAVGRARCAKEK